MPVPAAAVTTTVLPASSPWPGDVRRARHARLPRQAEGPLADDVALHLVGPAVDRVGPAEEEHRGAARSSGIAVGAEHVDGELADVAVQVGPEQLRDRGRRRRLDRRRHDPQRVQPHEPQADPQPHDPLAEHRVGPPVGRRARSSTSSSSLGEGEVLPERRHAPLEGERAHGDPPPVVDGADDVVGGGAGAGEERLVELAVAGELHDRAGSRCRAGPSARAGSEMPLCFGASRLVRASTKHQSAHSASDVHTFWPSMTHSRPSSDSTARVDEVGEVGAGAGLAVALAPQLLAGDDRRQEPLLLLGRAEGDDRRAEQRLADVADPARRPGPGVLLEVDDLLVQRQAPAAVLLRPADARPAVGAEVALPRPALVDGGVLVARAAPAPRGGELAGEARLEEVADLGAERLVLGAEPQVHRRRRYRRI